ncbi:unnamed protein product, partial [Gulo gulo]
RPGAQPCVFIHPRFILPTSHGGGGLYLTCLRSAEDVLCAQRWRHSIDFTNTLAFLRLSFYCKCPITAQTGRHSLKHRVSCGVEAVGDSRERGSGVGRTWVKSWLCHYYNSLGHARTSLQGHRHRTCRHLNKARKELP